MLYSQILSSPLTVEDIMNNVASRSYNCSGSALNFERWQDQPYSGMPQLLLHSFLQVTPAATTDSSLEAVIHSILLPFQRQYHKGQDSTYRQGPTCSNAECQGMQAQLQ